MPADIIDRQTPHEPVTDVAWLEFQFFAALHNLKGVAPNHYLVTTIEMALNARPDPSQLMMLRNQAE